MDNNYRIKCYFYKLFNNKNKKHMKKVILLTAVAVIVGIVNLPAQSELVYESGTVIQNGVELKPKQVRTLMANYNDALKTYNAGRAFVMTGRIVGYPCAFLFGWDLGTRLGSGEGNSTLLIVGATGTVVGVLTELYGNSKVKKSVMLYNSNPSNNLSTYLYFGCTPKGVGFNMQF